MRILIKKALITAPGQSLHQQTRDLYIDHGIITRIAPEINDQADQVIHYEHLHLSPGWMDVFADFCDPGYEYKEDLQNGAFAAAAGGFTDVMVIPNTSPALDSKAQIEYIVSKSASLPVNIYPVGTISQGIQGKSLAEMYEMHQSGAPAFSDGRRPVQSSGLLLKALQYVKAFDGILIQIPDDTGVSAHGLMHEGVWSARLGMQGKPGIAEDMLIRRDLELLRYTGSRLHLTGISLKKSVDLIREAKANGLNISCSITPYHLSLTDELLQNYDSAYKVNPPLREQADVDALKKAVEEGIIDCFATHHFPQDADGKLKEFEYAAEGMIGLESCFGVLGKALPTLETDRKITMLVNNPRKLFGLPIPEIAEGQPASLTLFDPDREWVFQEKDIQSKSKNTPFTGKELKGKVFGVINKKQIHLTSI